MLAFDDISGIKPIGSQLLVMRCEFEPIEGVPNKQFHRYYAKVLALGTGVRRSHTDKILPFSAAVGDEILVRDIPESRNQFVTTDKLYMLIHDDDVLAIRTVHKAKPRLIKSGCLC
ncbi:co-chaperone GroES family protein [Paraferrimonas sp. SM1919]|uniref:co-chaperone GroES family protein n=1 Tax=Paraferrimonas sp. SM1919 TaxID=2662263 RepID=UPI0013D38BC9|nr:co-chaperone GroES family protein [Paraferrimonas sp. SM1919]